ncbi:MAG: hypothetical protein ACFFDW_06690 [Candidatus Thorarchaeota archaeon]
MDISLNYYYWHEVAGPMSYFSSGKFEFSEEDLLLLLSSVEPYTSSSESSLTGPYYLRDQVIFTYNRNLNYPDAQDERIQLMGTDSWVLLSCEKENQLVLESLLEIVKLILDVEFGCCEEVSQLNIQVGQDTSKAIRDIYS